MSEERRAPPAVAVPDPLALARELIRCPSVTPADAGALDRLQASLEAIGFRCHRLRFEAPQTAPVDNLYARIGDAAPHFCFAGHTDVVPPGERGAWQHDPFAATVAEETLFGRGAADMKGAIACFVAAAGRFLQAREARFAGSISLLITGDEEGPAVNGIRKVLDWLAERGERIDHCIVGEPTNPGTLGEMVKVGRRGSLSGRITVHGTQGHVAYPHLADNPIPRLLAMLSGLLARRFEDGDADFQPSNLEITSVDVGNPAGNVIPVQAEARFNIRYNPHQTGAGLRQWIEGVCAAVGGPYALEIEVSGEPFLTGPGRLSDLLTAAVRAELGREPELSTSGGTSDARFIRAHCPVVEFGLVGRTMHKLDEQVPLADLEALTRIYERVLHDYFP